MDKKDLLYYKCATCDNRALSDKKPSNDNCGGCDTPNWKLMKQQEAWLVNGKDWHCEHGEI